MLDGEETVSLPHEPRPAICQLVHTNSPYLAGSCKVSGENRTPLFFHLSRRLCLNEKHPRLLVVFVEGKQKSNRREAGRSIPKKWCSGKKSAVENQPCALPAGEGDKR